MWLQKKLGLKPKPPIQTTKGVPENMSGATHFSTSGSLTRTDFATSESHFLIELTGLEDAPGIPTLHTTCFWKSNSKRDPEGHHGAFAG